MLELLFWLSVLLVVYPYSGYPVVLVILATLRTAPVSRKSWQPTVTILIPAYNEADCIKATIQNKIDQDYPRAKVQIIVISDGSTDGTDALVRDFRSADVTLLRREGREGKAAALNEAIEHAIGEIVIFSDANSLFNPDALKRMVENFADPAIGYVTGSLEFATAGVSLSGSGVNAYIRFENFLRQAESRFGSIIGVNGGVDAIRRELYIKIPSRLITDFVLPLSVLAKGYRVVFDATVRSSEVANAELSAEFRMRVRVALRALQGLVYMRQLLNPFRYPMASFCLISHKLLRYFAFLFLLSALVTNTWLALERDVYQFILGFHLAAYILALLGMLPQLPKWLKRLTTIPSYLLMSYTAFALAVFKLMRGESMATWRPRAG